MGKKKKSFARKNVTTSKKATLLEILKEETVVYPDKDVIISANNFNQTKWVLDLRKVIFKTSVLDLVADIFWDIFEEEYPFQVGGQELSAIPFVTAIILKGKERGKEANGFIIRKSRKKHDLQRIIEGELTDDKVVLVDDLINSGTTFSRQLRVLGQAEKPEVFAAFALVRFQKEINSDLAFLDADGKIVTLFDLEEDLGLERSFLLPPKEDFDVLWYFKSPRALLGYDVSKSSPALDGDKIYFGSDDRKFWALYQRDGSVAWEFGVGHSAGGKSIFSSPVIHSDKVYFGSYDGNLYALKKEGGKKVWEYKEADFISSSPCVAPELGLLFVGLEFALKGRRGGIVALDLDSGVKKWEFEMEDFVSASPAYASFCRKVFIGSNKGHLFSFDAKSGAVAWRFKAAAEIKATPSFSQKHNLVIVGSFDKNVYFLDIDSGEPRFVLKTQDLIFSTPLVVGDFVFIASSDKSIYKVNLKNGKPEWRVSLAGRIFSSPTLIDGKVFIGCNDGFMYEINPADGTILSFFAATERVVNNVVCNAAERRFFVSTNANEVYCLNRKVLGEEKVKVTTNSIQRAWKNFSERKK